jgi:hypothetical protein
MNSLERLNGDIQRHLPRDRHPEVGMKFWTRRSDSHFHPQTLQGLSSMRPLSGSSAAALGGCNGRSAVGSPTS